MYKIDIIINIICFQIYINNTLFVYIDEHSPYSHNLVDSITYDYISCKLKLMNSLIFEFQTWQ